MARSLSRTGGSACHLSRTGASACQVCARPTPVAWLADQTRGDGIVFDIGDDTFQFRIVPNPMIERFRLPKGLSGSTQNQVGCARRGALQPARNYRQWLLWPQDDVNVIRHDDPGLELIEVSLPRAVLNCGGDRLRHTRVLQPDGSESCFVEFAVMEQKGASGGEWGGRWFGILHAWYGAGQTPIHQEEALLFEVGEPVREFAAVEHAGLAGESACPTNSARSSGYLQRKLRWGRGGRGLRGGGLAGGSASPTNGA